MRSRSIAIAAVGALAAAVLAPVSPAPAVADVGTDPYAFDNATIGGGGYVPGMVFHPDEEDLLYVRTDIGGVYRWDEGTWTPLFDHLGWDEWSRNGAVSVALDPQDPDRVYVAAGMYTNDWDPFNGVIFRSEDRGETWDETELPYKLSGNMPGRGMGERLQVDPNDGDVLYFGAPDGNGLWRSTDAAVSWEQVDFPNHGHWAIDPGGEDHGGYEAMEIGLPWVTFDPRETDGQGRTSTIYVGVADEDLQEPIFVSHDAGESWEPLDGAPGGWLAHRGILEPDTGELYLPMADDPGPYGGEDGEVWRYDTGEGTWTDVTPPHFFEGEDRYYGFTGLSVDRSHPGTLVVSAQNSWWPDNMIWRSTDSGESWAPIWEMGAWPERHNHYETDIGDYPWLALGDHSPEAPEETPKLGWMMSLLEIDPHDPDRLFYGTGATIYGTQNLTDWDDGVEPVGFRPEIEGLEETAILDLVSPPEGPRLLSGMLDIGGFAHHDLDEVPGHMYDTPFMSAVHSLDYAEQDPGLVVRAGDVEADPEDPDPPVQIAVSSDAGENWTGPHVSQLPEGVQDGGSSVALAADGGSMVWSQAGIDPHLSTDQGSSWQPVQGLHEGAMLGSDRVNADVFYAYQIDPDSGSAEFLVSNDGGASFTPTGAEVPDGSLSWGVQGDSTSTLRFAPAPHTEGEIWLVAGPPTAGVYEPEVEEAGGYGLWHSTDGGETFTKAPDVRGAHNVAFGAPHPDAEHPAAYLVGEVGGVLGLLRSDDAADSWVRINDDQHQYGNMGQALAGDPNVYGRVYLGTDGRGIIYGDPVDPPDNGDPGNGGDNGDPGNGDPGNGNGDPAAGCTYTVIASWQDGFQGEVEVTNTGDSATDAWQASWTFPADQEITQMWGGEHTQDGSEVVVDNAAYNGVLAAGESASAGFLASGDGPGSEPGELECALT